ncbi:choice-of-anchor I family protein [Endozoicomonas sp. G2_2]|uniref:choice-of-anchor I family protein n=1 Tax=Endozoicomonas sp. G2_2 TaxID=2821092 RepID=UPI001ADCFB91|nr:choice-of-anchor I family protein [Endozoicomonas sp. G2_2]MBO9468968.1 choice-of-anchor I family protein [Endozoicomonas sp. G2_2]
MKHSMLCGLIAASVFALAACSDDDNNSDDGSDGSQSTLTIEQTGRYQVEPFAFDEGAAEIVAYDASLQRLFVVNANANTVDVLDIADPSNLHRLGSIDATTEGASANSVAVHEGTVAVAIEAEDAQAPGKVVFYSGSGLEKLGEATVGALPDMVTFTPNGERVLVANEGEPNDDYDNDPQGSISVVDLSAGFNVPTVTTLDFTAFNAQADALRDAGVRIFGPGATPAQDFEPEYIAVSADGSRAYISLQENNAIAVADLDALEITAVLPLGYKDHSVAGQGIDPSNADGLDVRPVPVLGMYQPDTIAAFERDGVTYLLTANEGDARDYDGFSEEVDVADVTLDTDAFPNAADLQTEGQLGDLKITSTLGDSDGDDAYEALYAFGARSFSIRRAQDAALVYDSGDDFERITGEIYGEDFNNDNTENDGDSRSDNKGPEPEAIAYGEVDGRAFAFIGLERMGGFFVYEIDDVSAPRYVAYINNRDLDADPQAGRAGDLGPESIVFIAAADSPLAGVPLLVVGNEISGSTTVYRLGME